MTPTTTVSRRNVLITAGAGAGALVLGACGASSDSTPSTTGAGAVPSGPAAAAPSSAPTTAPAASAPAAGGGTTVAQLADIPVGGSLRAEIAGKPVILAQPTAGKVVCHSAICTHQGCEVKAGGAQLTCPCHGSVFEAASGAVVTGPANGPLPSVAVSVSGTSVVVT